MDSLGLFTIWRLAAKKEDVEALILLKVRPVTVIFVPSYWLMQIAKLV